MKRRFVRVVHRQGWDVELVDPDRLAEPQITNFPTKDQAMQHARSLQPEWVEVGEIVHASGSAPQHHRWTTLRRGADGKYAPSALNWGGANNDNRAAPDASGE